jgi:hypothetical protein
MTERSVRPSTHLQLLCVNDYPAAIPATFFYKLTITFLSL